MSGRLITLRVACPAYRLGKQPALQSGVGNARGPAAENNQALLVAPRMGSQQGLVVWLA